MRQLTIAVLFVLATATFAAPAAADQPLRYEDTFDVVDVISGVCDFGINIHGTGTIDEKDFYDNDGLLTRISMHIEEQDTFWGPNGVMLEGMKFKFNIDAYFDAEGNNTHWYVNGLLEKVPLPHGKLFLSSGRIDLALYPDLIWVLEPDSGTGGDVEAFCAAMSE